jgi:shikimate dehydrogenase
MNWRLGVVGSPVAHSLTPLLHAAAFQVLGLRGSSEIIDIKDNDVARCDEALATHDALSVTMPLKTLLATRCGVLDERARRIGAVNSVFVHLGVVEGRSTDGIGFLDALQHDFRLDVNGRVVVVRGSGGSAKSLIDALSDVGAETIVLQARNLQVAQAIAAQYPRVIVNPPSVANAALVVSTVPTVHGASAELVEVPTSFDRDAVAVDIQYQLAVTPWLEARRADGLRTSNGLSMLVHQARHQLEWWFDRAVPLEPLLAAVGL